MLKKENIVRQVSYFSCFGFPAVFFFFVNLKYSTLGVRDFSCAVFGFGQVKPFLAASPFMTSAIGHRQKICRSAAESEEKNLSYPGYKYSKKETKSAAPAIFDIRRRTVMILFTLLLLFYRTYVMHWTTCMTLEFPYCGEK